jgi:hypothetical protein
MLRRCDLLVLGFAALSLFEFEFGNASRVRMRPPDTTSEPLQLISTVLDSYRISKESLTVTWDGLWPWVEDLPCTKPSNSGFQTKAATFAQSTTLRLNHTHQRYFLPEQFPVYHSCQVRVVLCVETKFETLRVLAIGMPESTECYLQTLHRSTKQNT